MSKLKQKSASTSLDLGQPPVNLPSPAIPYPAMPSWAIIWSHLIAKHEGLANYSDLVLALFGPRQLLV